MKYLIPLLLLAAFAGCKPSSQKDFEALKKQSDEFWANKQNMLDKKKAYALDKSYKDFAAKYPNDTNTASVLFRDADLHHRVLGNSDEAIVEFEQVYTRFPNYYKAPEAAFQEAFIYDNELSNFPMARKCYEIVYTKYPKSSFADQAKILANLLGKDLNKIFNEKGKDSLENKQNSMPLPQ
jgi:TolA-binding protein